MKLLRYGTRGRERPAMLDGGGVLRDLSQHVADIAGQMMHPASLAGLRSTNL